MNKATLTLFLLIICNSIFSQPLFSEMKVKSLSGKDLIVGDIMKSEKDQRLVLYIYISPCNFCLNALNKLHAENPELLDNGEVRLVTININWDEEIRETVKGWDFESYYYYNPGIPFSEAYGNMTTPLTIVFMNEEIIYGYESNFEGAKTLKTVLAAHPYVRYFNQGRKDVRFPVEREEADLVSYRNKFPDKTELVWRVIENNEIQATLSIGDPNNIPKNSDSLYVDGLYYGIGQGGGTVLVKNGQISQRTDRLEANTKVTYLNSEGAQTDKNDRETTQYKITDRFVPITLDIDKTLNERTVFRRVEIRDLDDNLLSYELWRGYNKELLFEYDLSEQPKFDHNLGEIEPEIEVIFDETEVEETVIESTDVIQRENNSNALDFDLVSKTDLESWVGSYGLDNLKALAKNGNAIAQRRLGRYHLWVTDSQAEALYWFKKSASQNDYYGLVNLAYAYQNGRGTDKDTFEAIDLFIEAIKIEPIDKSNATWGLRDLKGLDWTNKQKVDWYLEAAPEGNTLAQYSLASFYEKGYGGLEKSLLNAIKWYTKASEQGYEPAKKRLKEIDAAIGN